jgi:hypothetical protein
MDKLYFLFIFGGKPNSGDEYHKVNHDLAHHVLNHDSLYFLNLGTPASDLLTTPADHSFALQYRESGSALWSMVLGPMVVTHRIRRDKGQWPQWTKVGCAMGSQIGVFYTHAYRSRH